MPPSGHWKSLERFHYVCPQTQGIALGVLKPNCMFSCCSACSTHEARYAICCAISEGFESSRYSIEWARHAMRIHQIRCPWWCAGISTDSNSRKRYMRALVHYGHTDQGSRVLVWYEPFVSLWNCAFVLLVHAKTAMALEQHACIVQHAQHHTSELIDMPDATPPNMFSNCTPLNRKVCSSFS